MTFPSIEYKSHVLNAYAQKVFPTFHDPYARGAKQFSCLVKIDGCPPDGSVSQRQATPTIGMRPATSTEVLDLALRYGDHRRQDEDRAALARLHWKPLPLGLGHLTRSLAVKHFFSSEVWASDVREIYFTSWKEHALPTLLRDLGNH